MARLLPINTKILLSGFPSASASQQSQPVPSPRIFIKGLSLSTTEGSLKKIFSKFGQVNEVKVARNKASESLGYAFISYAHDEDALLAVENMNGKFVDGRFVLVAFGRTERPDKKAKAIRYHF